MYIAAYETGAATSATISTDAPDSTARNRRPQSVQARSAGEPLAADAGPADSAGRVADHERVGGHIAGDDGAGADEGVLADRRAADHHDPAPSVAPRANERGQQRVAAALDVRAGPQVVGEDDARAEEHVVLDGDAFEDHHLVLDGDPVADNRATLDVGAVADVAARADPAPASTWANAQIRVPAPTVSLSHSPCGCTKTPAGALRLCSMPPDPRRPRRDPRPTSRPLANAVVPHHRWPPPQAYPETIATRSRNRKPAGPR